VGEAVGRRTAATGKREARRERRREREIERERGMEMCVIEHSAIS